MLPPQNFQRRREYRIVTLAKIWGIQIGIHPRPTQHRALQAFKVDDFMVIQMEIDMYVILNM